MGPGCISVLVIQLFTCSDYVITASARCAQTVVESIVLSICAYSDGYAFHISIINISDFSQTHNGEY